MNLKFSQLLDVTKDTSVKNELKENQLVWMKNRRLQSFIISENYTGHLLGIIYLSCMVESTKSRINELEAILEIK